MDGKIIAAVVLLAAVVVSAAYLYFNQPPAGFSALRLDESNASVFAFSVENRQPNASSYSLAVYKGSELMERTDFMLLAGKTRGFTFSITGPASAVLTEADGRNYSVSRK